MNALVLRLGAQFSRDASLRWLVLGAMLAAAALGMSSMRISPGYYSLADFFVKMTVIFAVAGAVLSLGERSTVLSVSGRVFSTLSQFLAFLLASFGLSYVAASFHMPLTDDALIRIDALFGFHWPEAAAWVYAHPVIKAVLYWAYGTIFAQMFVLLFLHASRKSSEFLWLLIISDLITSLLAGIFPAVGEVGMIGQQHINDFMAAREGLVAAVNGILTFPSYHAALAVLFTYGARNSRLLYVALPLNLLMLASTPVVGGHYLTDVLAGIAVAVGAILIFRNFIRP